MVKIVIYLFFTPTHSPYNVILKSIIFDGQDISCLGLRVCAASVCHKILQMFFSEKYQVWRACPRDDLAITELASFFLLPRFMQFWANFWQQIMKNQNDKMGGGHIKVGVENLGRKYENRP